MEKSNKRGKIPQSDWPLIMARYEAGETLASIARTYDCSPPAISYVVSRSRSRQPAAPVFPTAAPAPAALSSAAAERSLIKAEAAPGGGRPHNASLAASASQTGQAPEPQRQANPARIDAPAADRPFRHESQEIPRHDIPRTADIPRNTDIFRNTGGERQPPLPRETNPAPRPAVAAGAANGDHRRTLHLSLGNGGNGIGNGGPAHGNGAHSGGAYANGTAYPQANGSQSDALSAPAAPYNGERYNGERANGSSGPPLSQPARVQPNPDRSREGAPVHQQHRNPEETPRKEGAGSIDHELRARVDNDIAVFLAAFDAALAEDNQENRSALREATDRLLRAGARTRIELERLEARVPLSRRDIAGSGEPAWRYR